MKKYLHVIAIALVTYLATEAALGACNSQQLQRASQAISDRLNSPSLQAYGPYGPLSFSQANFSGVQIYSCFYKYGAIEASGFFNLSGNESYIQQVPSAEIYFIHPYDGVMHSPWGATAWLWGANVGEFFVRIY